MTIVEQWAIRWVDANTGASIASKEQNLAILLAKVAERAIEEACRVACDGAMVQAKAFHNIKANRWWEEEA